MLNALGRFFKRGTSGEEKDPMAFLDEYAAVMNRHTGLEVYNGFKRGHTGLSIDAGFGSGMLLWLEDGQYCFDEEERGKVVKGGIIASASVELTQKVMVNYTVSILRHSLGLPVLGVPTKVEELPEGWSLHKEAAARYWMVLMASVSISRRGLRLTVWPLPGSTTCLPPSCSMRTCCPTVGLCFVSGWGIPT